MSDKDITTNVHRTGLTRLEVAILLVIGAFSIQILVGLVTRDRGLTRRGICSNNLRAIGGAVEAYHDCFRKLPPAAYWSSDLDPVEIDAGKVGANWVVLLLPYLNQSALLEFYDSGAPISTASNARLRSTPLASMLCPSDDYARDSNQYTGDVSSSTAPRTAYARGNYAINGGSHARCRYPGTAGMPCASGYQRVKTDEEGNEVREFQKWGNGVAGFNRSFSLDDFTNGLSQTVAIDEIRAGLHPLDPRGVWAGGLPGMSVTWAHGIHGDAVGPNNATIDSDDIQDCHLVFQALGIARMLKERMGCCDHCRGGNEQAGARSMHPGGVNVLTCDNAVHFIVDEVDVSIWHVMHSRENPQAFQMPK